MSTSNWRISEADAGTRLDKWLAAEARRGSRALAALEKGQVFLNEQEQSAAAAHCLQAGEQVRLWLDRPAQPISEGKDA